MRAFVDTNVIVRHLTQDPPDQGRRATALLFAADLLHLADVVVAETVYVLQSVYGASRADVLLRVCVPPSSSQRSSSRIELVCSVPSTCTSATVLDFADAYLVALAEASAVKQIASFDRSLDRVETVTRIEP